MTQNTPQDRPRLCVVVPTFNNRPTLGAVLRGILEAVADVIVVDDGSTDGAAEVLAKKGGLTVLAHAGNRGKGAALASGLARAAAMGFTHAVTLDADGQHLPADLPRLLAAVEAHPQALVVGVRNLAGAGRRRKSRLLRAHSNFWVWAMTGRWVRDTQSGFRAYPLETIQALVLKRQRYDFEIEVLVKALWAGAPVVEVPIGVHYGPEDRSHFRPVKDFALVSRLSVCLLAQRLLLPRSVRGVIQLKTFREDRPAARLWRAVKDALAQEGPSPGKVAACVGLGVFLGILPIWGFQIAAAVVLAHLLRLSKVMVVAASNISFPAAIPFILYASLLLGIFVWTGRLDGTLRLGEVGRDNIGQYLLEYVIGSVLLAAIAGAAAAAASFVIARFFLGLWSRA